VEGGFGFGILPGSANRSVEYFLIVPACTHWIAEVATCAGIARTIREERMFIRKVLNRPEPLLFANVRLRKAARDFTILLFTALTMFGFYGLAGAQTPPGTHLQIQDVGVDFSLKKITILGQMFNFGPGPLTVTLANVGNLTPDCTPNFTATPQTITCDLSGGTPPFPGAGDYLLTVSNGAGNSQIGVWDLTIGAVGPVGPTGPQGIPGIVGLEGQSCPSNSFVTGFSATGTIICSGETDPPPPPSCADTTFSFNTTSSQGAPFSQAAWVGGTATQQQTSDTACTVTVNQPSGAVDLVGGTAGATPWSVNTFAGYSKCFIITVAQPDCSGLSISFSEPVVQNYPTCTSGLCDALTCSTGNATDSMQVVCVQ
jgi:hypothetical protein